MWMCPGAKVCVCVAPTWGEPIIAQPRHSMGFRASMYLWENSEHPMRDGEGLGRYENPQDSRGKQEKQCDVNMEREVEVWCEL